VRAPACCICPEQLHCQSNFGKACNRNGGRKIPRQGRHVEPRGLLVIEVPRLDSLSYRLYRERWPGLQAPQHTVLYSKETLLRQVTGAGFEVVDYLPYGAYPAYFYLFAGAAFKLLKGRGLDFGKIVIPYFLLQLLLTPILLFERSLNLSMQTIVLRKLP